MPAQRITLTDDGTRILFGGPIWVHSAPVEELPRWLALHRELRDRGAPKDKRTGKLTGPGPYHTYHAPVVEQLEAIERQMKDRQK